MRKFTWVVMTNCDPAHEQEFNAWYDDVHIGDLLRIPGVVAARRSSAADFQMVMSDDGSQKIAESAIAGVKYRHLALYSIETDDIANVLAEVNARVGTDEMMLSPYLTEAHTVMFEDR